MDHFVEQLECITARATTEVSIEKIVGYKEIGFGHGSESEGMGSFGDWQRSISLGLVKSRDEIRGVRFLL